MNYNKFGFTKHHLNKANLSQVIFITILLDYLPVLGDGQQVILTGLLILETCNVLLGQFYASLCRVVYNCYVVDKMFELSEDCVSFPGARVSQSSPCHPQ